MTAQVKTSVLAQFNLSFAFPQKLEFKWICHMGNWYASLAFVNKSIAFLRYGIFSLS